MWRHSWGRRKGGKAQWDDDVGGESVGLSQSRGGALHALSAASGLASSRPSMLLYLWQSCKALGARRWGLMFGRGPLLACQAAVHRVAHLNHRASV